MKSFFISKVFEQNLAISNGHRTFLFPQGILTMQWKYYDEYNSSKNEDTLVKGLYDNVSYIWKCPEIVYYSTFYVRKYIHHLVDEGETEC